MSLLILWGLAASAQTIKVGETTAQANDEMEIKIEVGNDVGNYIAAGFCVELPDGFTVAGTETVKSDNVQSDHVVRTGIVNDSQLRVAVYSLSNSPLSVTAGTTPVLCSLKLNSPNKGGTFVGRLTGIELVNSNQALVKKDAQNFNIVINQSTTPDDYILGDLSGDKKINGMDIVEMVSLIMDNGYMQAADLYPVGNPDGKINGMDLVQEVELVMSQSANQTAPAVSAIMEKALTISENRVGVKTLGIDAHEQFVLAQMMVELTGSMTLTGINSDKRHTVACRQLEGNRYVVVCYSNENVAFESNTNALTFHTSGEGELTVSDALLVSSDKQGYRGTDVTSGSTTGIGTFISKGQPVDIYTTDGRLVKRGVTSTEGLAKGIYIINDQKIVVK